MEKTVPGHRACVGLGRWKHRLISRLVSNINGHRFPEERSINVISGFAEDRSLKNHSYDFGSIVTTVCCLNDIPEAFSKIDRILKRNGLFIIGLVDAKRELEKKVICYISSIEKG